MKLAKKVLSVVLAVAMILSCLAVAASALGPDNAKYQGRWWLTASTGTYQWTSNNKIKQTDNEECVSGTIEVEPGDVVWIRIYTSLNYYPLMWQTHLFFSADLLDGYDRFFIDRAGQSFADNPKNRNNCGIWNTDTNDWVIAIDDGAGLLQATCTVAPWDYMSSTERLKIDNWPTEDGSTESTIDQTAYKYDRFYLGINSLFAQTNVRLDEMADEDAWIIKVPLTVPDDATPGTEYTVAIPELTMKREPGKPYGPTQCSLMGPPSENDTDQTDEITAYSSVNEIRAYDNVNFDFTGAEITIKVAGEVSTDIDYTPLQTAINAKKALSTDGKTQSSITALNTAIANAEQFIANAAATSQDDVTAQVNTLNAVNLVDKADYTALNNALALSPDHEQSAYKADTWTAYQTALTAAQGVDTDLPATQQSVVDTAAQNLVTAFNGLTLKGNADYTALDKAIEDYEALTESWYTADTWAAATTAYNSAKAVDRNLSDEEQAIVTEAANNLNIAIGALVEADANYTALNALVEEVKNYNSADYKSGWGEFSTALSAAQNVNKNLKAKDQATIDGLKDDLETAKNNLVPYGSADYTALDTAIAKAVPYPENYYEADAWAAYATALADANAVDRNLSEAEQAIVDNAEQDLTRAYNALLTSLLPADYSAVETAINRLPASEVYLYTDASVAEFQAAVNAVVYGKKINEQADVDGYAAAINAVELVYNAANTAPLDTAIAKAEAKNEANYTAESWAVLAKAVQAGKDLLAKTPLDIRDNADIATAAQNIEDAILALVSLGADYTRLDKAIEDYEALTASWYTADSWAAATTAYNAAKAVAPGLPIENQGTIDAAAEALENAIAALVEADADYTALKTAIDAASTKKEIAGSGTSAMRNYTDESWAAFAAAKTAAEEIYNAQALKAKDQATIDDATAALTAATSGLEYASFDYTATKEITDAFAELNEDDYTPATWAAVQEQVNALVWDYKMDSYSKGMSQYTKLKAAWNKLALAGDADYTAVDAQVAAAAALNAEDWTAESWADLESALDAVVRGLNENHQSEVDAMATAIADAIAALVAAEVIPEPADYTRLDAAIEAAEALNAADWTADSWANLAAALDAACAVDRGLDENSQGIIDQAAQDLEDAIAALEAYVVPSANYTELDKALRAASRLVEAKYTEESWVALAQAVAAGAAVDRDLTEDDQAIVDAATDAINNAIAALVEKPVVINGTVTNVEYKPAKDTHNTFTIKVEGRASFVQFVEISHGNGTRSYDRYSQYATIVSYDAEGNVVDSRSRDLAYEVWTVYTNLNEGEVGVRCKYAKVWEDLDKAYNFVYAVEPADADLISAELAATSGSKKGPVAATVVTGPDTTALQFKMDDGSTCTYYADKATVNEDGTLVFTGKAWANHEGECVITIRILAQNKWVDAGTLTYTVIPK